LKKNKTIKINTNLRILRLGFLISFVFIPFKNKLLSLFYYSNGSFSYFLSGESYKLFMFNYPKSSQKLKKIKFKNFFFMLFQIQKLSFVSLVELIPGKGAQYTRSSGTKSRIIKFDYENHSVLLKLPSGVKKIFSYYSYVMLDRISLLDSFNFYNGKAGY
jgi:ribosomal protein L2